MTAEIVTIAALAGIFYLLFRRISLPVEQRVVSKREAIKTERSQEEVLFGEAEAHLRAGRFRESERYLLALERREPHYPKLYNRLGIVYLEQGNHPKAVEAFERAVHEDSTKASRHANLGMAYLQVKKYSLAKKSFQRALELDPQNEKYRRLWEDAEKR